MCKFVEEIFDAQENGTELPFVTVLQETVEIGGTWLTPDQQRTPANTEAKYLVLCHAFKEWDCYESN